MTKLTGPVTLSERLEKRLISYGGMAAAVVAAAAAQPAEAAPITYTFPTPVSTSSSGFVYWNMENHKADTTSFGTDEFRLFLRTGTCGCGDEYRTLFASGYSGAFAGVRGFASNSYFYAQRLQPSNFVGGGDSSFYGSAALAFRVRVPSYTSSSVPVPATTYGGGSFYPNKVGFLGLTWQVGPTRYYGWAKIAVSPEFLDGALLAIGYDDAGDPSHVEDTVPEPASVILMALGFAGLAAYRRRKKLEARGAVSA